MGGESKRRILCIDPTKQGSALFRIGRNKCNAGRRRQQRHRRRINNLKNIKTERVPDQRHHHENRKHRLVLPGRIPTTEEWLHASLGGGTTAPRGGGGASATAVMPCSTTASATLAAASYPAAR